MVHAKIHAVNGRNLETEDFYYFFPNETSDCLWFIIKESNYE